MIHAKILTKGIAWGTLAWLIYNAIGHLYLHWLIHWSGKVWMG